MAVHLDAGPDRDGRSREVVLVYDAAANVVEICDPLSAPPDLPVSAVLHTTVRQYHALKREARRGNPRVQERSRSDNRWHNRPDGGLKVSLGDLVGDALRGGRRR